MSPTLRQTLDHSKRVSGVAAGIVASSLWAAGPASAAHGNALLDPDNRDQYVEIFNLTEGGYLAAVQGRIQLDRSDITTHEGDGDIEIYDNFYTFAGSASTSCTDTTGFFDIKCDDYLILFDLTGLDYTPDTEFERTIWKNLGCHEFGHTGSVNHRFSPAVSCMRDEPDEFPTAYDQHDLDAINVAF